MSRVGIIANPASGKDIRRLVSQATVISNYEKTGIVKRVILGLDSTGVEEILIMPDYYGLGIKALEALNHHILSSKITILDFEVQGTQEDSIQAAQIMKESKVDCIITLGGDGTNRVVSKTCGEVPLIPISTGTKISSSSDLFRHFHPLVRDLKHEIFKVILLDAKNTVMKEVTVSEGSLTLSIVHPREVFAQFLNDMKYLDETNKGQIVSDFVAGMTDNFALSCVESLFTVQSIV